MAVFTLTVDDIPADDPWNWDDEEPFDDEWVLHDERGDAIAVERGWDGMDPDAALRGMAAERKIFSGWTDSQPDGDNRWTVTFPEE